MNKIKLFVLSLVTALSTGAVMAPLTARVAAASDASKAICNGSQLSLDSDAACDTKAGATKVSSTVKTVIQIFQTIVGLISVIMIIFGGLKYITSGGNDGSVKGAKNTILYAVIGLVIVAIAQFIVAFVLNRFE